MCWMWWLGCEFILPSRQAGGRAAGRQPRRAGGVAQACLVLGAWCLRAATHSREEPGHRILVWCHLHLPAHHAHGTGTRPVSDARALPHAQRAVAVLPPHATTCKEEVVAARWWGRWGGGGWEQALEVHEERGVEEGEEARVGAELPVERHHLSPSYRSDVAPRQRREARDIDHVRMYRKK